MIELRDTGIPAVGPVPLGTHFCHFYRTSNDLAESLVPFFKAGLEANESCLWITAQPLRSEDARTALRNAVPSLDRYVARGQLEIIDYDEWYLRAGRLGIEEVLDGWIRRKDEALAHGFSALRLTGNTYWVDSQDWDSFAAYEARVNETFCAHQVLALCSYCLDRCKPEGILDVIRNHQFAVGRRGGNWEMIESATLKMAKEELRRANEQLEQRVAERTAELEAALRIRDEFLSVASHELKTPLASLLLYVETTERAHQRSALAPDELGRRLEKARDQCRRLEKLVNNLLDVSRAAAGPLPLHLELVDLAQVATSVAERLREELECAGCTLTQRIEPSVVGNWDRLRLEQVVVNLLSNAARYARGTPVTLEVERAGGVARLTVRDRGPGIAPQDRARIFQRFSQLQPRTNAGGFGLGLWIVRQIAQAHGGEILLESRPGEGAGFTLELPGLDFRPE